MALTDKQRIDRLEKIVVKLGANPAWLKGTKGQADDPPPPEEGG